MQTTILLSLYCIELRTKLSERKIRCFCCTAKFCKTMNKVVTMKTQLYHGCTTYANNGSKQTLVEMYTAK